MKTHAVASLVLVVATAGCSGWFEGSRGWEASWGVAAPELSDTIATSAAAPSAVEVEQPPVDLRPKAPVARRKPLPKLGPQTVCAKGGKQVCQKVRTKIVSRLQSAGYSCG